MTKIAPNLVIYAERYYELVRPHGLTNETDFGLYTARFVYTDNPGGYLYTYSIDKGRLSLSDISGYLGSPKPRGWLKKLIRTFKKYPPKINGVNPVVDEHRQEFHYHNLAVLVKYTGDLVIGIGNDSLDFEIEPDYPNTFAELLMFTFAKGMVVKLDRVEGKSPLPPPSSLRPNDPLLEDLFKKFKPNK